MRLTALPPARRCNRDFFLTGLLLGGLPCGLSYAAFASAFAGADPLAGAAMGVVFGLGTLPGLLAVGAGAAMMFNRFRQTADILAGLVMLAMAARLLVNAGAAEITQLLVIKKPRRLVLGTDVDCADGGIERPRQAEAGVEFVEALLALATGFAHALIRVRIGIQRRLGVTVIKSDAKVVIAFQRRIDCVRPLGRFKRIKQLVSSVDPLIALGGKRNCRGTRHRRFFFDFHDRGLDHAFTADDTNHDPAARGGVCAG